MSRSKKQLICLLLLAVGLLIAAPVALAQGSPPPMPALCYGELSINGEPAPVGTTVVAKVDGEVRGELVTTEAGWYGGPGLKSKLAVAGSGLIGKNVRFYVSGSFKGANYSDVFAWEQRYWGSGEVMQINLGVKDVGTAPQASPPADPVPNPLPEPTEEPSWDTDPVLVGDSDTTNPSTGQSERTAPAGSSTRPSGSGGTVPFGGATTSPPPGSDPTGRAVDGEDEEAFETGAPAETETALSLGWTIGIGAVMGAAVLTLLIGFLVRKSGLRVKGSQAEDK